MSEQQELTAAVAFVRGMSADEMSTALSWLAGHKPSAFTLMREHVIGNRKRQAPAPPRPCTSCVYLGVPSPSPATRDDDLCDPCRAHFQAQPDEPDERGVSEYHAEEFALERGEDLS